MTEEKLDKLAEGPAWTVLPSCVFGECVPVPPQDRGDFKENPFLGRVRGMFFRKSLTINGGWKWVEVEEIGTMDVKHIC